jgi:hypothetical protein
VRARPTTAGRHIRTASPLHPSTTSDPNPGPRTNRNTPTRQEHVT